MRLKLIINADADGYESQEKELEAIQAILLDCDSSGFSISIEECEVLDEKAE